MLAYLDAAAPLVESRNPKALKVFVESAIVLLVARHEAFLGSLLATAVRHRQQAWRDHLTQNGAEVEKKQAADCDLRMLIKTAKRRVNLKKRGAHILSAFRALFGFAPWPGSDRH